MTPVRERPEWSHSPILLSDQQMVRPYQVLEEFFGDYSLGEIRQALQEELMTCLTTENAAFVTPEQRSGLLRRHDRLVEILEALFLVVRRKRSDGIFIAC